MMNTEDISKIVKTKRLSLTIRETVYHFNLFIISIIANIYFNIYGYSENNLNVTLKITSILLLLGLISFFIKWGQLSVQVFKIELTRKQIYSALVKLCETNKWHFMEQRFKTAALNPDDFEGGVIFAHSSFSSNSNKITIILRGNEIYINNIPDGVGKLLVGKWTPAKILNEIE